jgi:hypothetical protein
VIVHDGEHSHGSLLAASGIPGEAHPTRETKGLPDSENPMEGFNSVHRHLKGFLSEHSGYSRRDLQDWPNSLPLHLGHPGRREPKSPGVHRAGGKKAREIALSGLEEIKKHRKRLNNPSPVCT